MIDETGDRKKGKSTDYVDRQYIDKLGKIDNGIVERECLRTFSRTDITTNLQNLPQKRLKPGDIYKTKIQLAKEILQELKDFGFQFELVLVDSLYGESNPFLRLLNELEYPWIVAIRSNHGVLMLPGQRVRSTRWKAFNRVFSNRKSEVR